MELGPGRLKGPGEYNEWMTYGKQTEPGNGYIKTSCQEWTEKTDSQLL